jgi:hypothetical protein
VGFLSDIFDCYFDSVYESSECDHSQDAGIVCEGSIGKYIFLVLFLHVAFLGFVMVCHFILMQ